LFFICIYFSSLLVCIIRIYALTTIFPCTTLFRSPADVAARRNGDRPAIRGGGRGQRRQVLRVHPDHQRLLTGEECDRAPHHVGQDRKSTRLNSSHVKISYAVYYLKKKEVCIKPPF